MGQYVESSAWMVTAGGYGLRTYRAYVPHPLQGWDPVLGVEDLDAVAAADRALNAIASLPHTSMGAAIADWMAARDESIRSSIIEGVASTGSGLAWAHYADASGRPVSDQNDALTLGAARQIARAVELGAEMQAGTACRLEDVLDIHNTLFAGTRDRVLGGVVRDGPIWIGPPECLVDEATFVAPPPDRVPDLLEDLIEYLNTSQHPAVLKAAVAHAQFETIHPFDDGNGRTGRAIIHMVLNAAGAARGAVPISTALSQDTRAYYNSLRAAQTVECDISDTAARSMSIRPWLNVFSRSCQDAARSAAVSARRVEAVALRWQQAGQFRRNSAASKLLTELPSMPVLDVKMAASRLGIGLKPARRAIASLEAAGILAATGGRRNRRYHAPDLTDWFRQTAPDGGTPTDRQAKNPVAPAVRVQPVPVRRQCEHVGVRSERRCWLPLGHAGQHRYPPSLE